MQPIILIILSCDFNKYDQIELKKKSLNSTYGLHYCPKQKNKAIKKKFISLDSYFVHYFIKELSLCELYRKSFLNSVMKWLGPDIIILKPTRRDLIDYNWNDRVFCLVREKCELEYALSWLSTFGGAFSALGDYFEECAETAGRISIKQLQLAYKLGDPSVASRCRLYLSLSFIQKKKYRIAARIIQREYNEAKKKLFGEQTKLKRMCEGIWSKLKYEHELYRNNKIIKM